MKSSVKSIFKIYWAAAMRYPYSGALVYLGFGAGAILNTLILKLYYRDLFDLIAGVTPSVDLWPSLWTILWPIIIISILYNVLWRVADFTWSYRTVNILRDLNDETLEKLEKHSYTFFIGNFTGSLIAKVRRFVRSFLTVHEKILFNFWLTGLELVGVLIVLWYSSWTLGLFFLIWVVFYLVANYIFVQYRLPLDAKVATADSKVTGELADIITNVLNVKMFTSRGKEMRRYKKATKGEKDARYNAWRWDNWFRVVQSTTMGILEVGGMIIAVKLWIDGTITVGTIVLVQSYFIIVSRSAWDLRRAMSDFFRALSDADEMVVILETPIEVTDPVKPEKSLITDGAIDLEKVNFQYVKGKKVLNNFTLEIPAGQRVGIVGHSGAGKSTLFKLLLRFVDINKGSIKVDSQNIQALRQDDLRESISYVPQDAILFHRSLYENIAYANPKASKKEVMAAAKRAHAHEFIAKLPQGYDTLVGERGVKLSGGERQRVAIARAILKDSPILLLDEATSSLDSLSEKYIQDQLKELMKGKTTLAIAHRISTIKKMDRIIVMKNGRIIEDGSHTELLKKKGAYAELWSHQSSGFLLDY
jgi:ATP-binding cassette, subfamily B, bacterial